MATKSNFFTLLENLCKERGISVTKLAEDIGKEASTATGWRRGAVPRNDTLKLIADYFDIDINQLTGTTHITNNGIVGNGNKNNTITVGGAATRQITELEQELLSVFGKLDTMKKAELLLSAKKLLGE